jgi:2-phosphosulfolactate phosphatase
MALEDYLGAGAILSYLPYEKSPEVRVCEGALVQASNQLEALLWECGSGRELRTMGFAGDVAHTSQLNRYQIVPVMQKDHFSPWAR